MTTEAMTTEVSGNTKPSTFRGRAIQFTLNEIEKYEALKAEITKLKSCDYFISCKETAPKTGKEHIHMYVHFTNPYKVSKKIMSFGAHIEICRGSPKQNIEYIKKDGNVLDELGTEPHQGRIYTVSELKEAPMEQCPAVLRRIKKEIEEEENEKIGFMEMLEEIKKDELKAPKIYYISGETGKGKTYTGYKKALKKYDTHDIGKIQINNNFFKITNDKAKCFVIEEFRPSQLHAADFLQFTDKYGFNANTKGGFKYLRPEMIIICSIIKPYELYKDEINEQFLRRITKHIDLDLLEILA